MKMGLLSLSVFKKFLFFLIVLSTAYVLFVYYTKQYSFAALPFVAGDNSGSTAPIVSYTPSDYSEFINQIAGKKIFAASYAEQTPLVSGPDREALGRITQELTLTGVIPGDAPQVVIEDKKSQRSFYLKEGESFLDNITVESIGTSSCILNYQGESFELYF
jgi:hypothetical protein